MRRTPPYFAIAGLELARYFALVYAVGPFAAASPSAPQVLRVAVVPNALFAVGFLFLGLDAEKYAAYRPIILVGKAMAVFSSAIALPRLFGLGGYLPASAGSTYAILGIIAWDAVSSAALLFMRKAPRIADTPTQPEPERVELD